MRGRFMLGEVVAYTDEELGLFRCLGFAGSKGAAECQCKYEAVLSNVFHDMVVACSSVVKTGLDEGEEQKGGKNKLSPQYLGRGWNRRPLLLLYIEWPNQIESPMPMRLLMHRSWFDSFSCKEQSGERSKKRKEESGRRWYFSEAHRVPIA